MTNHKFLLQVIHIKKTVLLLALVPLILSIGIAPVIPIQAQESESHLMTKGTITGSHLFSGHPVWTILKGDQATVVSNSGAGVAVAKLDVRQILECDTQTNMVCFSGIVTSAKNYQRITVGDQIDFIFELPEKQTIIINNENLGTLTLDVDVSKVRELKPTVIEDSTISMQEHLRIGLLFSTTGDYSTYGNESHLAAMTAIDDFNEHLKSIDQEKMGLIPVAVNLSSNPQDTLEQVKKLHADGVDIFIGPETSAELELIKPYVDSAQILVISTSSTASSLAIADNIYRLVPDDTHQGKIISSLLEDGNITTVFLLIRDDIWGNGLANAIKESYSGKVSQINYDPDAPLYGDRLQELSDLVTAEPTKDETAIVAIGFGETTDFMLHATNYDVLDDVKWFGTDSNANEKKITQDDQASAFAQKVSFKAVQFASDYNNPDHADLESRLYVGLQYLPSTYAFVAYDAVWLAGLSMLEADSKDPDAIESVIPQITESYKGMLGDLRLNDAGDLESDNYDIWYVEDGQWYKELRQ